MEAQQKLSIRRRGMPAELMNELFGSLPLENAFRLLAQMPNGLLARNVQKMIIGTKEAMKNNKLNENDCGPGLVISDEGLTAKHSGPASGYTFVRAVLPIPTLNLKNLNKARISFYFEVKILNKNMSVGMIFGFCDKHFPQERSNLGWENNSIGIRRKNLLQIEGHNIIFENKSGHFKKGDYIGLGMIEQPNSSLELFATCNAELLGKARLSRNFANIELFSAIDLADVDDSIQVNFGNEEWRFKNFGRVIE